MTRQETFDKVARHLLTQNKQALNPQGSCVLRNDDGLRCAVGSLLTDEDFEPWKQTNICSAVERLEERGHDRGLLARLQGVHDNYLSPDWLQQLNWLAPQLGLSNVVLDEFKKKEVANGV